jgi:hypothetical protein
MGWVKKKNGQYADAIKRRTKLCLMLVESFGGINHSSNLQLNTLSKQATGLSAVDRTQYGRASSSARSYMQHHSQRLSSAAVVGDAAAICKKIVSLKQQACLLPRLVVAA